LTPRIHAVKAQARTPAVMSLLPLLAALPLVGQESRLGAFDAHADIGAPKLAGAATYDPVRQEYALSAGGVNVWHNRDEFHFAWRRMTGDFILRASIAFTGPGVDEHRKLGWMVRAGLGDDAPYADCAEHGDGLTSIQVRRSKGAATEQIVLPITHADVIQFERRGSAYIFSAAKAGLPFVSSELPTFALADDVCVGIFLCSHNADVVEKAVFSNVRLIRPAKAGFKPYTDYIGSNLEILDVETGALESIYRSQQPFEAPNWTRDGRFLIYNVSGTAGDHGRLRRFDLATRKSEQIDTGVAIHNNNDHVLSFDGTMLGVSSRNAEGGGSVIFTLPSGGGAATQLTTLAPSYLHGWSPDAKTLVFTGGRSKKIDVYKIPSAGGQEVRLTDAPGVNDGPEFSPDGRHIYFNSSRTGRMQIWRMRPDGSDQEQLTIDDYNNWFPHVSPDGKSIAFISFPNDISPDDHPYYKQVYIRLMPIEGGAPRVVAYVYGGQGSMNVPSWSPDGRKLAFVSNSDAL
jgi:TolB protein